MISIIIPVYNIEDYLIDCVESVLSQTYSDLQIILVDDGSTDGSGNICEAFKEKDNRVEVIHKKNGGVSSARNAGLAAAKGEYVSFVDGDDTIESNMMSTLLSSIDNYDLSICSYITDNRLISTKKKVRPFCCANWRSDDDLLVYLYRFYLLNSLWNKLFRREFIDFEFNESLSMGEDLTFVLNYLLKIKSIKVIDECLYRYKLREGSATNKFQPKRIDTIIDLYDMILSQIGEEIDAQSFGRELLSINIKKVFAAFENVVLNFNKEEALLYLKEMISNEKLKSFLRKSGMDMKAPYKYIFDKNSEKTYNYFYKKTLFVRLKKNVSQIMKNEKTTSFARET